MTRLLLLLALLALAPASAQTDPPSSTRDQPATGTPREAAQTAVEAADAASAEADTAGAAARIALAAAAAARVAPAVETRRPPVDADGPFGGFGLPILLGALLLTAVVSIAAVVTSRKRAVLLAPGSVTRLNQPQPTLRAAVPRPPAEPPATRAEVAALEKRVARIEQHLTEQSRPAVQPVQMQQAPPPSPAAPQSASAGVAASFASWCRVGGGLVDRHELFQSHLSNTLPDAAVEVVKRDLDSPARPIAFDATGGNSAAAYWLVRAGGELLLFPQPQSPQQFRDLAPAFEGSAAPQTVTAVEPARVSASGGGYVLTQPGRIA